ncbi:porin family protein [Candidatus Gracilibacteria bacterium]|nr:porin family protein [Candidatus Gracilibacteria bacterium]
MEIIVKKSLIAFGIICATLSISEIVLAECGSSNCKSLRVNSDNYIGVAGKSGLENIGVISKFKIVDLDKNKADKVDISIRPQIYFSEHQVNARVPVTLDYRLTDRIRPFAGAGVDYNTFNNQIQPVITGGVDYKVNKDVTITAGVDYLTETDDVEIKGGVGYNF